MFIKYLNLRNLTLAQQSLSFSQKMRLNQKILIKDPYLNTATKSQFNQRTYLSVPKANQSKDYQDNNRWKIEQEMKRQLERTQNEFKRMTRAYTEQNNLNRKILDYQAANNQYHQALKLRNFDLNNRLGDLASQNHLMANRFQSDLLRNHHQKDLMIRKFETQNDELIQAKKTINNLLQQKSKLEEQLQHLTFLMEKEGDRFALQMREQGIRMEGLERSLKNMSETKDQEIAQLRNRLRIYEDENKRLNDENKSLHHLNGTLKQKQNRGGIQNLSQINYLDSQRKQMKDPDWKTYSKQLQQQKVLNDKLQKQIDDLKKKLFQDHNSEAIRIQQQNKSTKKQIKPDLAMDSSNAEGLINSITTLRNGIDKQVFQIFYKSVKDGEKHRSNSLVIFIQNWKYLDLQRIQPYIQSYFQARDALKQICLSDRYKGKQIQELMQQCIPLRIALRKGRNQINLWILSTIQFTKNQRESGKKSMNNLLLFLFRLLTIQYRITYPMQGKSYSIDTDVRNELYHEVVKAINYIIQFK